MSFSLKFCFAHFRNHSLETNLKMTFPPKNFPKTKSPANLRTTVPRSHVSRATILIIPTTVPMMISPRMKSNSPRGADQHLSFYSTWTTITRNIRNRRASMRFWRRQQPAKIKRGILSCEVPPLPSKKPPKPSHECEPKGMMQVLVIKRN